MSINPFDSDPSVRNIGSQFGVSGNNGFGFGVDSNGDSFDNILSSEVAGIQGSIGMALDKLNNPLHNVQTLLDKIKDKTPIINTGNVSEELFRIAQEIMISLESSPHPDQPKMNGLGQLLQGMISLVEDYGSEEAMEKLTILYGQFEMNSYGHQHLKIQFIHWTRVESFNLDAEKNKNSDLSRNEAVNMTQLLQAQLAFFIDSIEDQDIAGPLIPFFNTSSYVDAAKEEHPELMIETEETTTEGEASEAIEGGTTFQEVAEDISESSSNATGA